MDKNEFYFQAATVLDSHNPDGFLEDVENLCVTAKDVIGVYQAYMMKNIMVYGSVLNVLSGGIPLGEITQHRTKQVLHCRALNGYEYKIAILPHVGPTANSPFDDSALRTIDIDVFLYHDERLLQIHHNILMSQLPFSYYHRLASESLNFAKVRFTTAEAIAILRFISIQPRHQQRISTTPTETTFIPNAIPPQVISALPGRKYQEILDAFIASTESRESFEQFYFELTLMGVEAAHLLWVYRGIMMGAEKMTLPSKEPKHITELRNSFEMEKYYG